MAVPRDVRFALMSVIIGASAAVWGCGSPAQPTPVAPPTLTGTWSGSAEDSSGPGEMTWQIDQSGSSVSGSLTLVDAGTNIRGRGSVSGSVSGTLLHFSLSIPAGGFDAPYESCTADVSGEGETSSSSLTGTYAGTSSCTGAIVSGRMTLTKRN
jgi:hypothetical protein